MNKEEFLQGLQTALSGNIPPAGVRDNLAYYSDYIRTELGKGRSEEDVMGELGDPRLIARTIIDTTPGGGEETFEEYHSRGFYGGQESRWEDSYGSYGGGYQDQGGYQDGSADSGSSYGDKQGVHYYDLNKWYWKVLAVVLIVAVVALIITIVSGLLSLVIPLLPVIGLVILIMWFVRGPRR